jgi:hypothetical protein
MSDNNGLMTEAKIERAVANSPEAEALQETIFNAVRAYADFLEKHGLICNYPPDPEPPRLKATALVVTYNYAYDYGAIDVSLKDGALDRVYGTGLNPDPWGRDVDPSPTSSI